EAKRPCRLPIDDEFEFGRLQDRQVSWLCTLENLTGVESDLTKTVSDVRSVAHQSAHFDNVTSRISCRNPVARRQDGKLDAAARKECVAGDDEGVGAVPYEGVEGRLDLPTGTGVEDLYLQSERACSFRYIV